ISSSPHSTIVPSDSDTEDAFSSTNILNYFPASLENIFSNSLKKISPPENTKPFVESLIPLFPYLSLENASQKPWKHKLLPWQMPTIPIGTLDLDKFLKCAEEDRVTFATGTLTNDALSWWNAYAQPIGIEQANKITWTKLKRLLTNKYCPRTEVKKMEDEFYNLVVKGDDLKTYVRRFQELAVLCPNMVPNFEKLMEAFIRGLPQSIKGNITASKPQTLEEATNIAHRLMDQTIKHDSVQETNDHKRKFEDKRNTIDNNDYPNIATTITTPTISTTTTIKITTTIITVTMITTTSRIEDKKLLGLILPKDTMETVTPPNSL
ncbi:reverse transcriptase domain-containing protein, partial [Tanacetum coccineum]